MDGSAHKQPGLLNDVLHLSRIEAGKLSLERVRFFLHSALHKTAALSPEQVCAQPLDFSLARRTGLPQQMRGAPGRLRPVPDNWRSTALKCAPPGGRIRVAADVLGAGADRAL